MMLPLFDGWAGKDWLNLGISLTALVATIRRELRDKQKVKITATAVPSHDQYVLPNLNGPRVFIWVTNTGKPTVTITMVGVIFLSKIDDEFEEHHAYHPLELDLTDGKGKMVPIALPETPALICKIGVRSSLGKIWDLSYGDTVGLNEEMTLLPDLFPDAPRSGKPHQLTRLGAEYRWEILKRSTFLEVIFG